MKINPISVNKLKYYEWYYSDDHKLWYYYKERKDSTFNYSELDDTLDPEISSIVNFLNVKGYKTLPSCSGHNRSDKFIKNAWLKLKGDCKKIRTCGLWLNNCENNNKYFLMDKDWDLPFSYNEFSDICSGKKEVVGYIGFNCNDERLFRKIRNLLSDTHISVKFDNDIIEIFNISKNDKIRKINWKKINQILSYVLK